MENNKDISKGINGLKALLIGMRNDNKELLANLALMSEKIATKDNVRLQVVAEQDGVRDVKVTNQPEIQKVEITNLEKAPEVSKVEVINPTELPDTTKINNLGEVTEPVVAELKEVTKGVGFIPALIEKLFEGIKSIPKSVFKVEVTNPTKQLENITIMNRQPSEAVPVVLVDRKGKTFYDAIFQAFTGSEVNLQRTNEKLDEVVAAIAGISVTVDMTSTNALITTTNTKLDTLDGRVDGIEALITLTNGYVDGIEALLTTMNGYLDGVETAIASTNTKLDTLNTTAASPSPAASASVVGCLPLYDSSMGATAQEVKASAGSLYGYHLINPNTTIAYVQIFNTASGSVTVGTTTPIMVLAIPPQGTLEMTFTIPISFSTAIVYACTTTVSGNTAMTTPPYGTFFYK